MLTPIEPSQLHQQFQNTTNPSHRKNTLRTIDGLAPLSEKNSPQSASLKNRVRPLSTPPESNLPKNPFLVTTRRSSSDITPPPAASDAIILEKKLDRALRAMKGLSPDILDNRLTKAWESSLHNFTKKVQASSDPSLQGKLNQLYDVFTELKKTADLVTGFSQECAVSDQAAIRYVNQIDGVLHLKRV